MKQRKKVTWRLAQRSASLSLNGLIRGCTRVLAKEQDA